MSSVPVDPANADALRAWDGDDGAYWAAHNAVFDASLARYFEPFLDSAAWLVTARRASLAPPEEQP